MFKHFLSVEADVMMGLGAAHTFDIQSLILGHKPIAQITPVEILPIALHLLLD